MGKPVTKTIDNMALEFSLTLEIVNDDQTTDGVIESKKSNIHSLLYHGDNPMTITFEFQMNVRITSPSLYSKVPKVRNLSG